MTTPARIAVLALSAFALAGAAAPQAAPPKPGSGQCFYARQLQNWQAVGDRLVNLRVSLHQYYQLELLGPCSELRDALVVGVESRLGQSWICSGTDVVLVIPRSQTHTFTQRCPARGLRRMSPEEAAALPRDQKP